MQFFILVSLSWFSCYMFFTSLLHVSFVLLIKWNPSKPEALFIGIPSVIWYPSRKRWQHLIYLLIDLLHRHFLNFYYKWNRKLVKWLNEWWQNIRSYMLLLAYVRWEISAFLFKLLSQFGLPRFNSGKFQHISKRENFYILNVLYWYSNVIIYA